MKLTKLIAILLLAISTTSCAYAFDLRLEDSDASPSIFPLKKIKLGSTLQLVDDGDGVGTIDTVGTGTVGAGISGYFPYYNATGNYVLGQTVLYTDGTSIGIGTTSPLYLLEVNGPARFGGTGGVTLDNGAAIRTDTTSGHTALLQAYSTGGFAYTTFGTLTAGSSPSLDFSTSTSVGSAPLVGTTLTQTLTNKTLTTPIITSISNSGTVTVPTGTDTLANLAGSQTFTNKTLTSPILTTPKITTSLNDSNGNTWIAETAASNAVNYLTVANSSIGNNLSLAATGSDSNINIAITPKGTGGTIFGGSFPSSPVAGDEGYDSSQQAFAIGSSADTKQYLVGSIFTATADKTVANTVTETSLVGTGFGTTTLPANFFIAGKTVKVRLNGKIATTGTPTAQVKVYLGSTAVVDTTAATLTAITGTTYWEANFVLTCRSTGGSGSVYGQGQVNYYTAVNGIAGIAAPTTSVTTVDTTASNVLDVKLTWGTASASNTITATNMIVEILN